MLEYQAHLTPSILSEDGTRCATGIMEVTLPFPPYAGFRIETSDNAICQVCLESAVWIHHEQRFECAAVQQEHWASDSWIDMEFLIREAREAGWIGFDDVVDVSRILDRY